MPNVAATRRVLALFPGIDLLGRAFEQAGYVVFRGPDPIFGGDIRHFFPPAGAFDGIVGGPPCQDFSSLRRTEPTGEGLEMLGEFRRVVTAVEPEWFLCENVSRVPNIEIPGYIVQRLDVDQKWFCDVTRLRHIQFGSRSGRLLHIERGRDAVTQLVSHAAAARHDTRGGIADAGEQVLFGDEADSRADIAENGEPGRVLSGAALASDRRTFAELCRLQGLPEGFDLPGFTMEAKKRAVGNGVPLPMGLALARAVTDAYARSEVTLQRTLEGGLEPAGTCACGCGRRVTGRHTYYDFSCRKRAQRKRDRARTGVAERAAS